MTEKIVILLLAVVVLISGCTQPTGQVTKPQESLQQAQQKVSCKGDAICSYGNVTRVIDGDTIEVDGIRIRLVLVDAPELSEPKGLDAAVFVKQLCPEGSSVLVDQDDLQLYDSYNRMLAVVWCGEKRLNEEILAQGHGNIYYKFCSLSEFGSDDWAVKYGC